MAYILMERHKQDALSVGAGYQKPTLEWLCDHWAERIIVMQQKLLDAVPLKHRSKTLVCDVGEDVYGTPWNFVLIERCAKFAKDWESKGFGI